MKTAPAELIEIEYFRSERVSLKYNEKNFSELKSKGYKLEQTISDKFIFVKPTKVIAKIRCELNQEILEYSFDFKEEIKNYFNTSRISKYKVFEYLECVQKGYIEFELLLDRKAYISKVNKYHSLYVNN